MNLLKDPFIQSLIARLNQPGVIGIAITGSNSRGEHNQHSDVDMDIFVDTLPCASYTLRIFEGKLISLKYIRPRDEYDSLKKPESAIWAAPGLRQMQILLDETGQLAKLKQAAIDFKWADLQDAANEYAVEELMACAEEAHKVISGLLQENESKVLYASWGLFKNMTAAVAVQAGLMIESENTYFSIVQSHFGSDHSWTRAFRLSFGMDVKADIPAWRMRGKASLELYKQTATLFKDIIPDKHREVIVKTLQSISSFQQGCFQ